MFVPRIVDFSPMDVKFKKYLLPGMFGKTEAEEMALRIIEICQEEGNVWASVSLKYLGERLDNDAKKIKELSKTVNTILSLDVFRVSGISLPVAGIVYLRNNGFIEVEKFCGDIYAMPTAKFFEVVRPSRWSSCVQKNSPVLGLFFF